MADAPDPPPTRVHFPDGSHIQVGVVHPESRQWVMDVTELAERLGWPDPKDG